jgi:hypothetical protein
MSDAARATCVLCFSLLLAAALAGPAAPEARAQTIAVQNGATVSVQNGAAFDLQGAVMDFGPTGATARLAEVSAGRVTGGRLTADRALSSPAQADPAGLGAVLSASADLGTVTVTRGHSVQTATNGNASVRRYYDIEPAQNNSGLSAELTFTYHDAELASLPGQPDESTLELFKSTDGGSNWTQEGADSRTTSPTGGNTVTLGGIASLSRWTLGSSASPLPVELTSFEAQVAEASGGGPGTGEGAAVRLAWQTASETGNAGFRVERQQAEASSDRWQQVGYVESKAVGGTSGEALSYRYRDGSVPFAADTVRYRLTQVDTDGQTSRSDVVEVAIGSVDQLTLKKPYPNPARGAVTVKLAVPQGQSGSVQLRLYNALGQEVRAVRVAERGRQRVEVPTRGLASGMYFLRLTAGEQTVTQRVTVVR